MAHILDQKSIALIETDQRPKARLCALEFMKIYEKLGMKTTPSYARGLVRLGNAAMGEKDYEAVLRHLDAAMPLMEAESGGLASVWYLRALALYQMNRFQECLLAHNENMRIEKLARGAGHAQYAVACDRAAVIYCQLKQCERAAELQRIALSIFIKVYGAQHEITLQARGFLWHMDRAVEVQSCPLVQTKHRMCNFPNCYKVYEDMYRCMSCLTHYLCKEHEWNIDEHIVVCLKFPDQLPEEKKLDEIVKCRRCRKMGKLMKCSVCESVWYCGAQCQKDDWKRHKVFCGKKE